MTTEMALTRPHPPRPSPTHSHIHTGPLVIVRRITSLYVSPLDRFDPSINWFSVQKFTPTDVWPPHIVCFDTPRNRKEKYDMIPLYGETLGGVSGRLTSSSLWYITKTWLIFISTWSMNHSFVYKVDLKCWVTGLTVSGVVTLSWWLWEPVPTDNLWYRGIGIFRVFR